MLDVPEPRGVVETDACGWREAVPLDRAFGRLQNGAAKRLCERHPLAAGGEVLGMPLYARCLHSRHDGMQRVALSLGGEYARMAELDESPIELASIDDREFSRVSDAVQVPLREREHLPELDCRDFTRR